MNHTLDIPYNPNSYRQLFNKKMQGKYVVILEIGHGDYNGNYVLDQYLPVDSIKTGIAIAKEAIKEYNKPNVKIEHPRKQVWIITEHRELIGDLVRSVIVKEIPIKTMESLKSSLTKK